METNIQERSRIRKMRLHAYIKSRLGFGLRKGADLYDLGCRALSTDGFDLPPGCTPYEWVFKHEEYITSQRKPRNTRKPRTKNHLRFGVDPSSAGFLKTFEWRKIRMTAILKYGRKCMCCGASPETGAVIHVDHIKPRKTHPELALDLNNLQILCHECNHGKGNWDTTDWRGEHERST